ncbi:MAG: 3-deoxy-D-manno-octulosonic acid transferase, partial [Candidatus Eisenbacteria bacterium]|nr:3-deoxy-D-manno-octulosonic acid transferase [Candidatus Eisenbacteria bacterium]
MSLPWTFYRLAAPLLGAVAPAAQVFVSAHERALWSERMGRTVLPGGCHAWVHAASLGEATAARALTRELEALQPGARLLLTATTRGGRERLGSLGHPVAIAPIDSPQATRRFFAGVRPARLILIETELWPHWLMRARAGRVPVAVVSARLSERSLARYRGLGGGLRALVAGLAAVLCQTPEDAQRWLALGSRPERTEVAGNLKDDALPEPAEDRAAARALLDLDRARPLLVLGSVRPGEVALLAAAWRGLPAGLRERWQVAALPRHPRAAAELRAEAARAGQRGVAAGPPVGGDWRWEDRLGVLPRYYAAADVAVVGGSLAPYGGHNPLEPAACGAAVIMGPHHQSQAAGVRALAE